VTGDGIPELVEAMWTEIARANQLAAEGTPA